MPKIYDSKKVDEIHDVDQKQAEDTMKLLAKKEGIFCGVSSGASVSVALKIAENTKNAVIVAIICDRGDRYLSTGVFSE